MRKTPSETTERLDAETQMIMSVVENHGYVPREKRDFSFIDCSDTSIDAQALVDECIDTKDYDTCDTICDFAPCSSEVSSAAENLVCYIV